MKRLAWAMGLGATAAITEAGIARYFFRRTMIRQNTDTKRTMDMAGGHWEEHIPEIKKRREWLTEQPSEEIFIKSRDGLKLHGTYFPVDASKKIALCFHGYTGSGTQDFAGLAKFYIQNGFQLIMPDARAHGKSEGTYIGFGCLDRFDVLSWLHYISERFGDNYEVVLHGISMGGATVLMASGQKLPACVKAIISDCAFTSAWNVFDSVLRTTYHIPPYPILKISNYMVKREAGYEINECNAADEVRKAIVPILFIHGSDDTFVPTRMCHELYANCASRKRKVIIAGAGHGEAYYVNTKEYEDSVLGFLKAGGMEL